jgi:hypothetical protein
MTEAAKKELQAQTVLCAAGYAAAGIMVTALTEGVPGLEDDDKEEIAAWRKFLYYALTQYSDSVPLIGDAVTAVVQGITTGKTGYRYGNSIFPAADDLLKTFIAAVPTAEKLSRGDGEAAREAALKAAENLFHGLGLRYGLPVSGIWESMRAFGVGDGDGEGGINPGAFMGRRKNK